MRKKLFILALLILPILLLTGCEGKKVDTRKSINITDPVFGYSTTFKYEKEENFSEVKSVEGGAYKEIEFENPDLDVEFQMYYTKMSKNSYDKSKVSRAAQKYYKEYNFNGYESYAYGDYSSGLYLNILLGVDSTDTAKILFVSIDRLDTDETKVVAEIVDKELKEFFNSIEAYEVDA
jgi:hypothetical protein